MSKTHERKGKEDEYQKKNIGVLFGSGADLQRPAFFCIGGRE